MGASVRSVRENLRYSDVTSMVIPRLSQQFTRDCFKNQNYFARRDRALDLVCPSVIFESSVRRIEIVRPRVRLLLKELLLSAFSLPRSATTDEIERRMNQCESYLSLSQAEYVAMTAVRHILDPHGTVDPGLCLDGRNENVFFLQTARFKLMVGHLMFHEARWVVDLLPFDLSLGYGTESRLLFGLPK